MVQEAADDVLEHLPPRRQEAKRKQLRCVADFLNGVVPDRLAAEHRSPLHEVLLYLVRFEREGVDGQLTYPRRDLWTDDLVAQLRALVENGVHPEDDSKLSRWCRKRGVDVTRQQLCVALHDRGITLRQAKSLPETKVLRLSRELARFDPKQGTKWTGVKQERPQSPEGPDPTSAGRQERGWSRCGTEERVWLLRC